MGRLPVYADGHSHEGTSRYLSVRTALHRNGTKLVENADPLDGSGEFTVPAGDAEYRLTSSVWQHRGRRGLHTHRHELDVPFQEDDGTDTAAAVHRALQHGTRPGQYGARRQDAEHRVSIQGAAGVGNLKSLAVRVSYDDGRSRSRATPRRSRSTTPTAANDNAPPTRRSTVCGAA